MADEDAMRNPLTWLLGRRPTGSIEQCSSNELRHIKQEADYLSQAIESTKGSLAPEDMERLNRLTRMLNDVKASGRDQPSKRRGVPEQPVPHVTADDVDRIVRRDFSTEQFPEVAAVLKEYSADNGADRVRVAALKLAKGDLARLRVHIQSATRDWRDVLAAAEYPEYMKVGFRAGKLPTEEQTRIIENDWRQYDEWFRKPE